ncbi:unnamed protein product [Mucor circinelloides]|uniref:Nascent polypeptide-associated complex subunit alpha-like UBA domain-containing protein n=1 Tax=Mucor circinelloides f. circinelloides (strain 1006PhL) TaxID=1220926 RepID=S2JHA4_MUCC1|nr:hypothetical protein HMPREF1544_03516 [Mucor circinelloides 1006PhL]KAG1121801.1 hypothetical protein G6F42_012078 [Rhizopus arrhizus]
MSHDHHDHSNCNHDHGSHSHSHGDAKKVNAVNDELSLRQQAADKLAKSLVELQELANQHKKATQVKTSSEPVNKADVDLLMKEMQITKAEAESTLRSNKNDVVAALTYLTSH